MRAFCQLGRLASRHVTLIDAIHAMIHAHGGKRREATKTRNTLDESSQTKQSRAQTKHSKAKQNRSSESARQRKAREVNTAKHTPIVWNDSLHYNSMGIPIQKPEPTTIILRSTKIFHSIAVCEFQANRFFTSTTATHKQSFEKH